VRVRSALTPRGGNAARLAQVTAPAAATVRAMTEPRVLTARPIQRTFPGRADQIARAREFTKRVLGPCPVTDEAVLLVSELATNAVKHTSTADGGQFQVTICRTGTSLLIGVSDNGSAKTPEPGPLDPESETGQGLGLVDLIADRWGTAAASTAGPSGSSCRPDRHERPHRPRRPLRHRHPSAKQSTAHPTRR
jgi:anti-sigma regulatory factor (Ser/Thr protein kinase)